MIASTKHNCVVGTPIRVLVAEDEEPLREAMCDLIAGRWLRITSAPGGGTTAEFWIAAGAGVRLRRVGRAASC
jgi:hypothetical protein